MFLRDDHGYGFGGGSIARRTTLPAAHAPGALALRAPARRGFAGWLAERYPDFEIAPDLGSCIGSAQWWRGAVTCAGLCAVTLLLAPGLERPILGAVPAPLSGDALIAARAQSIDPLGQGAITGAHMAATRLVTPLKDTPERPIIHIPVTLGSGDSMLAALRRSGVSVDDAGRAVDLVQQAVALKDLKSGTSLELTLGRRPEKGAPRPLEQLAFRARFDLNLEVNRADGALALNELPIAIDHTPLHIRGEVGDSLYRSARAAGVPAKAVEAYLKAIATRTPVSRIGSTSQFDMVVERARAETGEVQYGQLLYAGLTRSGGKLQLLRWDADGKTAWFDSSGKGETTGAMKMPTNGRISSNFGMRRHPILGYTRMHKGIDIATPWGSPVYAANDGVVQFAGRSSGYGNFVKIKHPGVYGTGYAHLSRILVRPGEHVRRGEIIARSGNSGLSTGPHLHYEVYKNGVAINPRSVSFTVEQRLTGRDLGQFRAKLSHLLAVPVAGKAHADEDGADDE